MAFDPLVEETAEEARAQRHSAPVPAAEPQGGHFDFSRQVLRNVPGLRRQGVGGGFGDIPERFAMKRHDIDPDQDTQEH